MRCKCGYEKKEHIRIIIDDKDLLVCPNNTSGLAPSVYVEDEHRDDN